MYSATLLVARPMPLPISPMTSPCSERSTAPIPAGPVGSPSLRRAAPSVCRVPLIAGSTFRFPPNIPPGFCRQSLRAASAEGVIRQQCQENAALYMFWYVPHLVTSAPFLAHLVQPPTNRDCHTCSDDGQNPQCQPETLAHACSRNAIEVHSPKSRD